MKWISIKLLLVIFMICQSVYAGTGSLFNVTATGQTANVSITLCLNGRGALSCQNYTVSGLNLNIITTVPNHVYSSAGIKVNSPGYTLSNCTPSANGFCLFSVSDTAAAAITVVAQTSQTTTLAVGFNSTTPISFSSANGSSAWSSVTTPAGVGLTLNSVAGGGGSLVIGAQHSGGSITTTPLFYNTGNSWQTVTNYPNANSGVVYKLTYGQGTFAALAYNNGSSNYSLWWSTDAINWSGITQSIGDGGQMAITYGDSTFVAMTYGDYPDEYYSSTPLSSSSWNAVKHILPSDAIFPADLAYGNGIWVTVGDDADPRFNSNANGSAYYTTTAGLSSTWSSASSNPITSSDTLISLTYGTPSGGSAKFVAISQSWKVYFSTNGSQWSYSGIQIDSSGKLAYQIRYDASTGLFTAVGAGSLIYTSSDLTNWTKNTGFSANDTFSSVASSQ